MDTTPVILVEARAKQRRRIMRKAVGAVLGIALVVTAFGLWSNNTPVTTKTTQAEASPAFAAMSPFELMLSVGKELPAENWPAH
jgi:hypothetical protein